MTWGDWTICVAAGGYLLACFVVAWKPSNDRVNELIREAKQVDDEPKDEE